MDHVTRGLAAAWANDHVAPLAPWPRVVGGNHKQRRLNPQLGGGRSMRHPYYRRIVYPRLPDRTSPFLDDPIRRTRAVVTKTLDGAAVDHFQDFADGVVITEIWGAGGQTGLSTTSSFFRQLLRYRTDVLPDGQYIGWQCPDLSPKKFWIELLDVRLGQTEDYPVQELGPDRPHYLQEQLSVSFKLVREARGAAGVAWFEGL